jgi:hypothetical protein
MSASPKVEVGSVQGGGVLGEEDETQKVATVEVMRQYLLETSIDTLSTAKKLRGLL